MPINQNFDYGYPITPTFDLKTSLSGIFLLSLLVLALVMFKPYRIISFSILWFFIALSVESSLIPIGHVIAEYRLYLASIGFVFLAMNLIFMFHIDQKLLNIFAICILIIFSFMTRERNNVWRDGLTLWNDTICKSPDKASPYWNRGWVFYEQGNLSHALADYNKAISINPNYPMLYVSRGLVYNDQGDYIRAFSDYNKAITLDPKLAEAYLNRGLAYDNQGNLSHAISEYNHAIALNPDLAMAYNNRGLLYDNMGRRSQAILDYNKAIEIDPGLQMAYNNRGMAYFKEGSLSQAFADYNKAIDIDPSFAIAYNDRGWAYFQSKDYDKARSDVGEAMKLGYAVNPAFINALKAALGKNATIDKN